MKTAITEVMDIIEMEHNNGVEISQKVLYKMLLEAKEKEKQQIIEARNDGHESTYNSCESGCMGKEILDTSSEQYYNKTYGS